jgi:hypothetical protein
MTWVLVAILAVMFPSTASAETIYYGSRAGMLVTVTRKADIGSTHARIWVKHSRENAISFCRDYVQKVTPKCIADEMKVTIAPSISANCRTGKFVTLSAHGFHFIGPNPKYDPTGVGEPEYLILNAANNQQLDGSSASGYDVALGQFKELCPNR